MEVTVAKFPQLFCYIFLCDGLSGSFFYHIPFYGDCTLSGPQIQFCGLPGQEFSLHGYRKGQPVFQMLLPDILKQSLITTAVSRAVQSHHLPAVVLVIITILSLTADIEAGKRMHICRRNLLRSFGIRIIPVNIFAINCRNSGGIFRLLHTAFDLKGVDPCLQKFRNIFNGTHIFQA